MFPIHTAARRSPGARRGLPTAVRSAICLTIAASACSGSANPLRPGSVDAIAIASGNAQSGVVGQQLPQPVVVRVSEASGAAAVGAVVHFTALNGGSVAPDTAITDASGSASTAWRIGAALGADSLTVTVHGAPRATVTASGVSAALFDVALDRIDGGNATTCALDPTAQPEQGAQLFCWGENSFGQFGNGSLDESPFSGPVGVVGGSDYTAVALSLHGFHTCALTATEQVLCWGASLTQLGENDSLPTSVPGAESTRFVALSMGATFACAIDDAHAAWCWGLSENGQLGIDSGTVVDSARLVAGGHVFTSITSGYAHTCALTSDGTAWCWGANDNDQLGVSDVQTSNVPMAVNTDVRFVQLSAGAEATCGITAAGAAYCWGNNLAGQGGTGAVGLEPTPTLVSGSMTFRMLSVGGEFTCGIGANGAAYCWGNNLNGEIGTGAANENLVLQPTAVTGDHIFVALGTGLEHVCALASDGSYYCWGGNPVGQAGQGPSMPNVLTPTQVAVP